jgi:hypothetical protein
MENKREQPKIADGNKDDQPEYYTSFMPDAPRLYDLVQAFGYCPSIENTTARRDKSEYCCHQTFISAIDAESEWLQQPEYCPNDDAISDTVSQPVLTLLKRICTRKK